jgi:hypothetical protein
MQTATSPAPVSKGQLWTGRILSGLTSFMFLTALPMLFFGRKMIDEGMNKYGYSHTAGTAIVLSEFVIGLLTAIPRTSILGVVLMTAYLGGAVSTHVRAGEPFFIPIIFAGVAWLGIYLRDPRLRDLLPIRK